MINFTNFIIAVRTHVFIAKFSVTKVSENQIKTVKFERAFDGAKALATWQNCGQLLKNRSFCSNFKAFFSVGSHMLRGGVPRSTSRGACRALPGHNQGTARAGERRAPPHRATSRLSPGSPTAPQPDCDLFL